jgi:hypothetical protein
METKAPHDDNQGTERFTTFERPLRRTVIRVRNFDLYCLTAWSVERGCFLPTAPMRSSL